MLEPMYQQLERVESMQFQLGAVIEILVEEHGTGFDHVDINPILGSIVIYKRIQITNDD